MKNYPARQFDIPFYVDGQWLVKLQFRKSALMRETCELTFSVCNGLHVDVHDFENKPQHESN